MAQKNYGNWKIIKPLQEGGQAHTYLVENKVSQNGEIYVLKRLKNKKRIDRFITEIETVLKLSHNNIIQIVDFDHQSSSPYLVMKYIKNGSLEDFDISQLSLSQRLKIIIDICKGVAYAHENGIIHRDLKPGNIFMNENLEPVVGDFGICFIDNDGERFTITDEVVGPRYYMAPELEDGRLDKISKTVDVYSIGKILYWILAGKIFSREKHRNSNFDLTKGQQTSDYFIINEILDKMIVAEPELRYQNASEVFENLNVTIERIKMKAHSIDISAPQPCNYCGIGNYKIAVTERNSGHAADVHNFGFNAVGSAKWQIFVCNHCGNVQMFRLDYTDNPNVWKSY